MAKIFKFPTKARTETLIVEDLLRKMDGLDKVYQDLDQAHKILNDLEQELSYQEREFDELLKIYAEAVGGKNLDQEMLRYSSNTEICIDEDTQVLSIRWITNEEQE
jgi:hypothetical protein|tara:strand:- start:308 stop:625 length:318 start_codon:yes stop_codon:yes gene_type:complete